MSEQDQKNEAYNEHEFRKEELQKLAEQELADLTKQAESTEKTNTESKDKEDVKTPQREFTEVELEQMEKGWDPDHPDGVSAKEFKRVGEIIEAKRKASKEAQVKGREVEELTKTVKQLIEDQREIKRAAYEQAKKDLVVEKLQKIREGDVDAVMAIEQKQQAIAKAAESITTAPEIQQQQAAPVISAEVQAFKEKHKAWLETNSDDPVEEAMRGLVKSRVEFYMKNDPNIDEKVAILDIENRLKKAFPDKFETRSKIAKVATSTTSGSVKGDYTLSRLTFDQRAEYNAIRAVDSTYSVEEHIKNLEMVGRLSK